MTNNETIPLGNLTETGHVHLVERKDAAENRARILEVAARLFAERGIEAVCMSEIAQAAGVGKGTLYRRFANKAELCLMLMDTQLLEFQNTMIARMQVMRGNEVPAMEQLGHFLDALIAFTDTHAPLLNEVQREGLLTDLDGSGQMQRPHFWQYMTVYGLLQTAVQRREIPVAVDTAYLADALLAPLSLSIFRLQRNARGFSLERMSAGLRTLLAGLTHLPTED